MKSIEKDEKDTWIKGRGKKMAFRNSKSCKPEN